MFLVFINLFTTIFFMLLFKHFSISNGFAGLAFLILSLYFSSANSTDTVKMHLTVSRHLQCRPHSRPACLQLKKTRNTTTFFPFHKIFLVKKISMIFSEGFQSCFDVDELSWLNIIIYALQSSDFAQVAGKLSVIRTTNCQFTTKCY